LVLHQLGAVDRIRYILENDSDHWRSRQLVAASTSAGYGLSLDDIERELTTS
jgi:hypothetical protein